MTEITWTNCADEMPPETDNTTIVIRRFNGIVKKQKAWLLRVCATWHPELYAWTPYTPKKWKELNKCAD